jgi:hypothetical protein
MKTLTFRTTSQAVLFEREICGQLSDGHWENALPNDHWQPWCDAEILVGSDVGRNFNVRRDAYSLANKDLLDVVEKRMLGYVRLGIAYGREAVAVLRHLVDCDGWEGMPPYEGEYWNEVRAKITAVLSGSSLEHAKSIVEDTLAYTCRDLRRDLREMAVTMKTYVLNEEQLEKAATPVAVPIAVTPVAGADIVRQVAAALQSMSTATDNLAKLLLGQI